MKTIDLNIIVSMNKYTHRLSMSRGLRQIVRDLERYAREEAVSKAALRERT
jgi:hypothetical protein